MSSMQRKQAIQSIIRRGQLKQLAIDLNMSYSYLSQAFSPSTTINFTDELARKVEKTLGLEQGRLEQGDQFIAQISNPQVLRSQVVRTQGLVSRGLLAQALRGRAADFITHFPKKRVETNVIMELGKVENHADLIVYNNDGSVFMIAEQSNQYNANNIATKLIMLMAISGSEYGVVFEPDSGINVNNNEPGFSRDHKRSEWYQYKQGRIIPIENGPGNIFEAAGI